MFRLSMLRVPVVCAAGLFCVSVAAAQTKVAIINIQKAIIDTAEIKKAQADLQARYKPRQDALDKAQRELADLQTQLQNSSGKLSPQGEQELNSRAQRKQREVTRLTEDLQADVERDRNDILSRAGQRMTDVVKKIAEEKGFDVVIDVTNSVYFKPALEITSDAVAAYDKANPVKK